MRKRGNVEICRQKAESRKERRKSSSSICIRALAHQDHVVVALLEPLGQEWFGLHQRQRPHCRNWLLDCLPAWCPCYPLERVVELFETDDQEPQPPHKQQQSSPQAKEPQAIVDLSPTMCQVRSCTGHDCAHTHAHTHAHTRTPLHTHAHAHTHTHTHAHARTHTLTHPFPRAQPVIPPCAPQFPLDEENKVVCRCGAYNCSGYMNWVPKKSKK